MIDGSFSVRFKKGAFFLNKNPNEENPKYKVRMNLLPEPALVDSDLPTSKITGDVLYAYSPDRTVSGKRELWPSILEKAFAVTYGDNNYIGIEWQNPGTALSVLLNSSISERNLNIRPVKEDDFFNAIKKSIESKTPTLLGTRSNASEMPSSHTLVPVAVNSTTKEVSVYDVDSGEITKHSISTIKKECDFAWNMF
jgi:hypothetical protein